MFAEPAEVFVIPIVAPEPDVERYTPLRGENPITIQSISRPESYFR